MGGRRGTATRCRAGSPSPGRSKHSAHRTTTTLARLLVLGALLASCSSTSSAQSQAVSQSDWPTYGHDALRSFHGQTTITEKEARALKKAWYFPTGDAVTATPTVVNGVVYAGSWDGWFYAVNLRDGRLVWKTHLAPQNAVTPYPGQVPRDITSDGGLVTSSAWFQPGSGHRPDLVIFGGGYTLYALNAKNGAAYWTHAYTGRPDSPPNPSSDGSRIFSSPVVADGKVFFGVDTDGERSSRGYVVAASLATGDPVWEHQTDVDTSGHILDNGCGSVWSSGTLLEDDGLVVFDVADCHFSNPPPTSESVIALRTSNGKLAWRFRPPRSDQKCDLDFGATPNAGLASSGQTAFLGVGGKDGTYYSIDPLTGKLRWSTNVVFGGFSGGFIATAAYDGAKVYGATAIGDFGRFEGNGVVHCAPGNARDTPMQEPSMHAFDARTGAVSWQANGAASFAPTTVAGGMTFNCPASGPELQVRDVTSGRLEARATLQQSCWSGVATVGNALVLGTGSSYQGNGDGIEALTPGGVVAKA
jgi:outer membrane protein assembly factor BamB